MGDRVVRSQGQSIKALPSVKFLVLIFHCNHNYFHSFIRLKDLESLAEVLELPRNDG
jgi:hypothetical protein